MPSSQVLSGRRRAPPASHGPGGRVSVDLVGAKRLVEELNHLSNQGARKAIRSGANKAVVVIKKAIKREIPGQAKSLKTAIRSEVKVNKKVGVVAKVGINLGLGKYDKRYKFYASMYILGTQARFTEDKAIIADTSSATRSSPAVLRKARLKPRRRDGLENETSHR